MWYGNVSNQDCKALQRVVRLAERIPGSALPSLQDIYLKRCKSRAAKIIKDLNHPGNRLFILLPSVKRFRSMMAKPEKVHSILSCTFYFIAHLIHLYFFLLFVFLPIFMYILLLLCYNILHCPLSGPDLTYISLLIIFCIVQCVTNKTLNPWT